MTLGCIKSAFTPLLLAVLGLLSGCSKYSEVAKFDLGDGFECKVKMEDLLEPTDPLFYSITKSAKTIIPPTYIMNYPVEGVLTFEIIVSDDRRFVGLVTKDRPQDVLMLFDKYTIATWPRAGDHELPADVALRGDQLLRSFLNTSKKRDLKLSRY